MTKTHEDIENHLITSRLLAHYLAAPDETVWTVEEDACVQGRTVANRYGVPADAITRRYIIEHVTQGWTFTARAVWRNGRLMEPLAVHVAVEGYYDDNDALGGPAGARSAANAWLRSLPL
jgi:hypothetical protein